MEEDDFFDLLENSICSEYVDYLESYEGFGYYIPFITTINYLTHTVSRRLLEIDQYKPMVN